MLYIVRDFDTGAEQACPTLRAARYASLGVKKGEIVLAKLDTTLSRIDLRCALFNRDGYATETTSIATIENGIARKLAV